jgi:hypothetical protein
LSATVQIDEALEVVNTTGKPEVDVAYNGVTVPAPTGSGAGKVMVCGCAGFAVLHPEESVKDVPSEVTISHETWSEFEPTIVFPTYP